MAVQPREDEQDVGQPLARDEGLRERLRAEARRYRSSMSPWDIDDAVARTEERLVVFRGPDAPVPYAYAATVLRNVIHDMYRSEANRDRGWWSGVEAQQTTVTRDVADTAVTNLDVRRALGGLPKRQREVAVLVDMFGYQVGDAAATLDLSPKAAQSLLQRARQTLRTTLAAWLGALVATASRLRRLLTPTSTAPAAVVAVAAVLYVVAAPIHTVLLPHVAAYDAVDAGEPRRAASEARRVPAAVPQDMPVLGEEGEKFSSSSPRRRLPGPPIDDPPVSVCVHGDDYCTSDVAHGDKVCANVQEVGTPCAKFEAPIFCDPLRRVAPPAVTCTRDKAETGDPQH